jgi:hypothetical protein
MGKITGFMEFEKKERNYVDISERIQSYKEFVLPLSEEETKSGRKMHGLWNSLLPFGLPCK